MLFSDSIVAVVKMFDELPIIQNIQRIWREFLALVCDIRIVVKSTYMSVVSHSADFVRYLDICNNENLPNRTLKETVKDYEPK